VEAARHEDTPHLLQSFERVPHELEVEHAQHEGKGTRREGKQASICPHEHGLRHVQPGARTTKGTELTEQRSRPATELERSTGRGRAGRFEQPIASLDLEQGRSSLFQFFDTAAKPFVE
jgi:hypothetical protein